MARIVGIGGGTGLPVLLRGLRSHCENLPRGQREFFNISAIVCVSDNGGSSGSLRNSYGIPAVGDLRNCLVALSKGDRLLGDLFQYRFSGNNGLEGHSLGNLIVTAFCQMSGSLGQAVASAREILGTTGSVFPVTENPITLCAELETGAKIRGEFEIANASGKIKKVWLEPGNATPANGVLHALACADAIILGPGSLYTSIIPNLLVPGVAAAVRNSSALKIYVCNLVTQRGETDGFSASDHLRVVTNYLGPGSIDVCVLNSQPIEQSALDSYAEDGSQAVGWSEDHIAKTGVVGAADDLLAENSPKIRHDSMKLARLIVSITDSGRATAGILGGQKNWSSGGRTREIESSGRPPEAASQASTESARKAS